tara:strand:+ start:33344 stop:34447 length:1104 start_codon:yes stop_codon:yes gene_type:complete
MKKDYQNTLPYLQHFEEGEIGKKIESFRKGEKGIFWFLKLGILIAVMYFSWIYVLPVVFKAIGQVLAISATLFIVVALVIMSPVIIKGIRLFTRFLHKSLIKHDPFAELEKHKAEMKLNKTKVHQSKGKIMDLKRKSEVGAAEAEETSKHLQKQIVKISQDTSDIKGKMKVLVQKMGEKAKNDDKYINLAKEFRHKTAEGNRKGNMLKQKQQFVIKYGTRANMMKKFGQRLGMVESAMEIKILDFDATISILKDDYAFAQESKNATQAAKSAMGETTGWELDYALDIVTSTIAQDIAETNGNLKDIDYLMTNYPLDSDELFDNLSNLADDINTGINITKSAKAYSGEDYEFTHEDKLNSGGFGEGIF